MPINPSACFSTVCFALLTVGCNSFGPLSPELAAQLEFADPALAIRRKARVRVESEWFSGEFNAIVIEERRPLPRIRLQLLPDVGGKLLDLVASPEAVTALWAHSGKVEREWQGLTGFLAVSLLEGSLPISPARVLGSRSTMDGHELELMPVILGPGAGLSWPNHSTAPDLEVHVDLDEDGKALRRRYRLGRVGWTESLRGERRFESRNFEWRVLEESWEPITPPSERIFQLNPQQP